MRSVMQIQGQHTTLPQVANWLLSCLLILAVLLPIESECGRQCRHECRGCESECPAGERVNSSDDVASTERRCDAYARKEQAYSSIVKRGIRPSLIASTSLCAVKPGHRLQNNLLAPLRF